MNGVNELRNDRVQLLVVDDDDTLRLDLVRYFSRREFHVSDCADADQALSLAEEREFDVIVTDMMLLDGMSGIELLEALRDRGSEAEVVMLTGQGTIETAVKAMKLGASEFLTKPTGLKELEILVSKCVEARRLRKENRLLKAALQQKVPNHFNIVGESDAMKKVFNLIDRTAASDKPTLIQGESGTGKELVAKALHQTSGRANTPLITINCAALPEHLLESELFGYEKGAFTGAVNSKPGLFEIADGGTLFIDELGELAPSLQAKLLRVLEDGSLRRLGSVKQRSVNARIIAATNRDMNEEVEAGRFRDDLFYRLNVLSIDLPPLRVREGDIRLLATFFAGFDWDFAPEVMQVLESYSWPGNVRQLQNAIDRAKLLAEDETICRENLPPEICSPSTVDSSPERSLDLLNKLHIQEVYWRHDGNKTRTARALGVGRRSLYRLLEKYDIGEIPTE